MRAATAPALLRPAAAALLLATRRPVRMVGDSLRRERQGPPMSPEVGGAQQLLLRYFYEGSTASQGRLCVLTPEAEADAVMGSEVLRTLQADGVDLSRFFACAYETEASGGGWLPMLRDVDLASDAPFDDVALPLVPAAAAVAPTDDVAPPREAERPTRRRVDVKLFRRAADDGRDQSLEALMADAASVPSGELPRDGYHAIGVLGGKTRWNVGTLWRGAYQLGSSFLFTVGARYRNQRADTTNTLSRLPFFELDDWNAFVEFAPRGALWVAIEMGGEALETFEHPRSAIYILGSEDAGLPPAVLRACHRRVSLSSERYASFNQAMAGSIVLYDRMVKQRLRDDDAGAPRRTFEPFVTQFGQDEPPAEPEGAEREPGCTGRARRERMG